MELMELLKTAVQRQASDVIVTAFSPIMLNIHGRLSPFPGSAVLSPESSQEIVYRFLNTNQRKTFEQTHELDMGFEVPDLARFRISVYRQRGATSAVLRIVPLHVPAPDEIGLAPLVLSRLMTMQSGLLLITGPTGAGKSTTIASMIDHINKTGDPVRHILTIEDPIEFNFTPKRAVIDQREVGIDTEAYQIAVRSALRELCHVIFVGEMRDRPTMEVALTAAETGNLVVSTVASQSAARTINRIIDTFPLDHQNELRTRLSMTLRAVISQILLPRADRPGRICAREVMFVNYPIANLIREGKIHQVNAAIETGASEGMVLMDDAIVDLCRRGILAYSTAVMHLNNPEKLRVLETARKR